MSDLLFPAEPGQRAIARELYALARDLPLISPHGHVDPAMLADDEPFPDPARLIIVPDHYLTRMLLSQGIPPARLGVPSRDGEPESRPTAGRSGGCSPSTGTCSAAPRRGCGWSATFATSSASPRRLAPETADEVYDAIADRLAEPDFRPRALFERFNIEVLATTESPLDDLAAHAKLAADGWGGRVVTTFRPDDVVDMEFAGWADTGRPARRDRR